MFLQVLGSMFKSKHSGFFFLAISSYFIFKNSFVEVLLIYNELHMFKVLPFDKFGCMCTPRKALHSGWHHLYHPRRSSAASQPPFCPQATTVYLLSC